MDKVKIVKRLIKITEGLTKTGQNDFDWDEWEELGWRDPYTAMAWSDAGWDNPVDAKEWFDAGWNDPTKALDVYKNFKGY